MNSNTSNEIDEDTQGKLSDMEALISQKMHAARIPGLSVAVVMDGETIYTSGFGFADLDSGKAATADTLFQLGSNSKAFTALGVFHLQKDGLIDIKDPITKYIPWLTLLYEGQEADVTIEEFINHTSGIPSNTIDKIPQLDETHTDAIEKTVETIVGLSLANKPGAHYEYATINYDVLGLLIEETSGMKYEEYIQTYVLDAGGLNNTCLYKSQAEKKDMALGYKIGFFSPKLYTAPRYEGNKPAGYIISNAIDMAEWLKIQLNTSAASTLDKKLVEKSHEPRVATFGDSMYYTAGWQVFDNDGTELYHAGKNPNYSSYVVFRPADLFGVAVLCNIKSNNAMDIGESILELFIHDRICGGILTDENIGIDNVCAVILFIAILILCLILYPFIGLIYRLVSQKRRFDLSNKRQIIKCSALLFVFLLMSIILYFLPALLLNQSTWGFLFVWYPLTVKFAVFSVYICFVLIIAYAALKLLSKPNDR